MNFDPRKSGIWRSPYYHGEEMKRTRVWDAILGVLFMAIVALCLALAVCGCWHEDDDEEYDKSVVTPLGYHVQWQDQGLITGGYATAKEVLDAFDASMLMAADYLSINYGANRDHVLAVPHAEKMWFTLVDNIAYQSVSGRVTGDWTPGHITVAMHRVRSAPVGSLYPSDSLPWTRTTSTISPGIYWGILDLTDSFPALGHEMGHALFGGSFEH